MYGINGDAGTQPWKVEANKQKHHKFAVKVKVKLSHYTPWRLPGGEEV
jgi:hypothetical protein